jgi:hypothetical protein
LHFFHAANLIAINGEKGNAPISAKQGIQTSHRYSAGTGINSIPIQLPYVQEEVNNMSQEEEKTRSVLWWAGLIALLILIIIGGAYVRWKFLLGVF